jgi:uncharacterized protein (DUF1800 family)
MTQKNSSQAVCRASNAAIAAVLCALMAAPQSMMGEEPKVAIPVTVHTAPLTQQEKVLHALNRLTFGPRPGDEASVSKMGLEKWFELQLHPEKIDDAALDARLEMFPAMELSQAQLEERFPSPQKLRQMERQDTALPADPVEHAIYADAEYTYKEFVKKQAAGGLVPNVLPGKVASDETMAPAATQADDTMMANGTMAPVAADAKDGKKAFRRANVMDADGVDAVLALAPEQRMQQLVAMSPEEMLSFRVALKPQERPRMMQGFTPAQIEVVSAMQAPGRVVGSEVLASRLERDVYSDRQLQAVMTDFWLNHFSVYVKKNQNESYYLPQYQRDVVLPNALGNFEQLLVATAKSPAMLMYLDNWESIGPDSPAATRIGQYQKRNPNGQLAQKLPKGINENYARELMELHTLGVGGGYTQADVIAVAKCFTGWTIDRNYQGGGSGEFIFQANRHEGGSKVVLGHTIPEGGMDEGLAVLHILATSPATAHFVSQKLAVRFVSDTPPAMMVDRMAATFLKTDGDIKAVLMTMFHSPEFWAPTVYRAKVKTPIEFMVSALRASGADVRNPLPLVQAMDRLGMPIYGMQTPNGYSWMSSEWVSSNALISRMNFALVLSGDRVPGTQTNWPVLLGSAESSGVAMSPTPATEKQLEGLLLGEPAAVRTRATVLEQFSNPDAQKTAEQNFNAKPVQDDEAMGDAGPYVLAGGKGGKGVKGQGRGDRVNAQQPETPLDTMAGLLLGSPDFQRR